MLALALLLQVAAQDYSGIPPLPRYSETPNPSAASIRACSAEYNRLQKFTSNYKTYVFQHTLDFGGRLEWRDGNNIRYTADLAARNYLEGIRRIAWQGRVVECRSLANQGVQEVTERAIRPVFGNRVSYIDIMRLKR